MNCWHCRRTAVATCRFCGRGVCENHVTTRPFSVRGGLSVMCQDPRRLVEHSPDREGASWSR